jgi:hypothetical protein
VRLRRRRLGISCSPASKVPHIEHTCGDDAEDEQCLHEDHGPTSMTGEFDDDEDQHPDGKDGAESQPLGDWDP